MSVTYGFFNSVNGDRKYDADQMSEFYNGIVTDGVFQHVDNGLEVTAGTGMTVNVATGRAIIQNKWVKNDSALTLDVGAASDVSERVDAVVIRFNSANRNVSIVVKQGGADAPSMTRSDGIYEMALAYINIQPGVTSVNVVDKRSDTDVCGWAAVAQSASGEVDQMLDDLKIGYDGTTYSTPAAEVQGSDQILQDQIDDGKFKVGVINQIIAEKDLIKTNAISENKFLRTQDGGVRDNSSFNSILTFIPVEETDKITSSGVFVYYYNSSFNFISAVTEDMDEGVSPQNTAYIRLCWNKSSTPSAYIIKANGTVPCLFDGTMATFKDGTIPATAISGMEILDDSVNSMTHPNNLISGQLTDGYYLRGQDGALREASGFKTTLDYIDVTGATKILIPAQEYACFYSENTTFISATPDATNVDIWYNIPENTKYIRATCIGSATAEAIYLKNENGDYYLTFDPKSNLSFAEKCIPFNAVNAEGVPAVLPPAIKIVAPTGGDYTSIIDANAHCDGSYAMWILPGTYEGEFQAGDDTYGNKRTRKVYVGLSKDDCVAVRYGTAYGNDVFHTNGKTYMKNLSLKALKATGATSCGYALHLDNGWLVNGKAVFEDCYFLSEGRAAAGIGTRPNCDIVFRNCIFETAYDGNGAVFFHNDPNLTEGGNQRLTFENCIFHSQSGVALHIEELGGDSNEIILTMINCTLYSDTLGAGASVVSVNKADYTGSLDGNVHLTARSHGNNVDMSVIL